jgi:hypothetical protein
MFFELYTLFGIVSILDSDVAKLYGVETKRINEAVKNNPEKFPAGYVMELSEEEHCFLRSKFSTLENSALLQIVPSHIPLEIFQDYFSLPH